MDTILKYFSDFTPQQTEQFAALQPLYTEWNEKINVISRKNIQSLYENHVLHSLSIAAVAQFTDGMQVIDIGTGGGFPGVPLAIFFPEVHFHLVDSIGKKLKVVEAVAEAAGIKNISTQHSRVEDIKTRKFDFAVSRAVAPLKDLWHWAKPLLKKGSEAALNNGLICLKGGDLTQEIFESGLRPNVVQISELFKEPYFEEKIFAAYKPVSITTKRVVIKTSMARTHTRHACFYLCLSGNESNQLYRKKLNLLVNQHKQT